MRNAIWDSLLIFEEDLHCIFLALLQIVIWWFVSFSSVFSSRGSGRWNIVCVWPSNQGYAIYTTQKVISYFQNKGLPRNNDHYLDTRKRHNSTRSSRTPEDKPHSCFIKLLKVMALCTTDTIAPAPVCLLSWRRVLRDDRTKATEKRLGRIRCATAIK